MRYVFGKYLFDTERHERSRAGEPVPLRPKVFQALVYLLAHRDRGVRKQELLEQLWPRQAVVDTALNSYIMAVRQAIGDQRPTPQVLRTVRGYGYRFVAPVESPEPALRALSHLPEQCHTHEQAIDLRLALRNALFLSGDLGRILTHLREAEAHYQQALTLADELGMRPFVAHGHLGLSTLYTKIGRADQAHTELSIAMDPYRSMDMMFWLPQAEAILVEVEGR